MAAHAAALTFALLGSAFTIGAAHSQYVGSPPLPTVTQASSVQAASTPATAATDSIFGIFEGRTPCAALVTEFTGFPSQGCEKVKWELTLHRDTASGQPTSFVFRGTRATRQGRWRIERPAGTSGRVLYRLHHGRPEKVLTFLAVDDDVLLLLDANLRAMVGDATMSYALNRVGPAR